MRTITPCFIQFWSGQVRPTYDSIDFWPLCFLLWSGLDCRVGTLNILPEFTPTPTMLEKHADKGLEEWEIYAWCIRDVISKASGLPKHHDNLTYKDKNAYDSLMEGRADRVEVCGQIYEYSGSKGSVRGISRQSSRV